MLITPEQDPELLSMIEKYWPDNFKDPRLKPYYSDGKKFLNETKTTYDVILVGAPYPVNLPLNRYYTEEFFKLARKNFQRTAYSRCASPGRWFTSAPR